METEALPFPPRETAAEESRDAFAILVAIVALPVIFLLDLLGRIVEWVNAW